MKNLFITIIFLMLGFDASAQKEFSVLISQGENRAFVYSHIKVLEMGMKLSAQDTISVADSGYVALFHNPTGKVIEFTYKGLYGLKETNKKFNLVPGPPLCTFEEFRLTLYPPNSVYGVRSAEGRDVGFSISRNYSFYAFKEKVKIEWNCAFNNMTRFRLELKEEGSDDVLFDTLVVNKLETVLNFKAIVPKLKEDEEQLFRLSIRAEDGFLFGGSNIIRFYDQNGAQKKMYEFINKARAFYGGNSAIENYVLGMIYQKKQLIANAFQAYKNAHQLAPHVKIFRDQYIEIGELSRNTK